MIDLNGESFADPSDLELVDSPETKAPIQLADLRGKRQIAAEVIALAYIAIIAEVAIASGAFYILFPELAALSHDIFTRPRGSWASAPVLLMITPVLTAVLGTFSNAQPSIRLRFSDADGKRLPGNYSGTSISNRARNFGGPASAHASASGASGIRRESSSEQPCWPCSLFSGSK